MDTHPTPFPGKRRPAAANPATKVRDRNAKPSTQQAPPARPKRAFGVARSTNIPVERPVTKPLPAKPSKPWKPSGNGTQKSSNDISGNGSGKAKAGNRRTQQVSFQEPAKAAAAEAGGAVGIERSFQDEGLRTPMSSLSKGNAVVGTPYQTAENCSKCRFDKLETSTYWLAQIMVAESAGKHFVSADFFRLAFECQAQPFPNLQSELKHYVTRHKSISSEILWIDLCKLYGLSDGQSTADPSDLGKLDAVLVESEDFKLNTQVEVNCETLKDECFEIDINENIPLDMSENSTTELIDTDLTVTNDDVTTEEFVDVKAMPSTTKDSPFKIEDDRLKSRVSNVSGKKSSHERFNSRSLNHSSSGSRAQRAGGSSGKVQEKPGLKVSAGKPERRTAAGSKHSRNSQILMNQGKEDEKGISPSLSDGVSIEGVMGGATATKDQDQEVEGLPKPPPTSDCQ